MFDLGFIGFGNIAQALANGLSSSNYSICTYDIQKPKRNTLRALNVTCLTGNEEVVEKSKIIFFIKNFFHFLKKHLKMLYLVLKLPWLYFPQKLQLFLQLLIDQ